MTLRSHASRTGKKRPPGKLATPLLVEHAFVGGARNNRFTRQPFPWRPVLVWRSCLACSGQDSRGWLLCHGLKDHGVLGCLAGSVRLLTVMRPAGGPHTFPGDARAGSPVRAATGFERAAASSRPPS